MSKPVVVTIPHQLGQEEATRRLKGGLENLLASGFGNKLATVETNWSGSHLDFTATAMGQKIAGRVDVMADAVRLEIDLPFMLALFAEKAKAYIQKSGTLLLEKK